jgi:hypothetical protein
VGVQRLNRYDINKESAGSCLKVSPDDLLTAAAWCSAISSMRVMVLYFFRGSGDIRKISNVLVIHCFCGVMSCREVSPAPEEGGGNPRGKRRENHEVIPTGWL